LLRASGGAAHVEECWSLMQMAKTSGALAQHATNNSHTFLFLQTQPPLESWPALLHWATLYPEPKSMIGFAGPRVIKETTHQELPERFQTAEFSAGTRLDST